MTHGDIAPNPDEFESGEFERFNLARAVFNGQLKLIEAKMKDEALLRGDVEGTRRYSVEEDKALPTIDGLMETRTVYHNMLVPGLHAKQDISINRIYTWFPTYEPQEADEKLELIQRNNLLRSKLSERQTMFDFDMARLLSVDMFCEVEHVSGKRIKFLINPIGLFPYEDEADIVAVDPKLVGNSVRFGTKPTIREIELRAELQDWLPIEDLAEHLEVDNFEPEVYREPND